MKKKTTKKSTKSRSAKPAARPVKDVKMECKTNISDSCKGGAIYGLGFIGALVYYIQTSAGFWSISWGIVKALFWPAFLIYEVMKFIGM